MFKNNHSDFHNIFLYLDRYIIMIFNSVENKITKTSYYLNSGHNYFKMPKYIMYDVMHTEFQQGLKLNEMYN